jgi:pimeloyl-ACP methyl ester carboxylesterase
VIADCKVDVAAIMNDLGINRIAVWGFSGGASYALATAALRPEAVAAVSVLAPRGPYELAGCGGGGTGLAQTPLTARRQHATSRRPGRTAGRGAMRAGGTTGARS